MNHFEFRPGESPDFATANDAPLESYVGPDPTGRNSPEAPRVKSILIDLPRAGSAGQVPSSM